jgi:RNA polymerase sigma-70 factor (ECF subfamily)
VFDAEFGPLHRYLHRRVGDALAEDLAVDTFTIALRHWEQLDPARPVKPWIYGIAGNLLRHHWRKERRMLRAYAASPGASVSVDDDETVARVDAALIGPHLASALAELRREEREVLLLHAWADLTDVEIAEALSLPLGTVKSRLSRARAHIRNHLGLTGQIGLNSVASTVEERQS